jgi:hypothetical protein
MDEAPGYPNPAQDFAKCESLASSFAACCTSEVLEIGSANLLRRGGNRCSLTYGCGRHFHKSQQAISKAIMGVKYAAQAQTMK